MINKKDRTAEQLAQAAGVAAMSSAATQRVDVARLSELLSGIVGDYKVCLGVSQKAFEDFSLRGSPIGKLPNQSWGLHCRRRIEELEALPALLQQLAELERDNETMRGADYHQAGVEQEQEIIDLESKLADRDAEVERLRDKNAEFMANWGKQLNRAVIAERAREEARGLLREAEPFIGWAGKPDGLMDRIAAFLAANAPTNSAGGE